MIDVFDDACRREVETRCAAFSCLPPEDAAPGLKPAAVAIVLLETESGPGFLLTRRAAMLRAHSNQWALPGGRCDPGETPADAALRELDEEVGLRLGGDDVLGVLDPYPTRSGYLVTPVVAWAASAGELRPNPAEVSSVHRIPLSEIMRPDAVDFIVSPESGRQVIRFMINGDYVHAPTAAMIYQFREVLAGRSTRVADIEQPRFAWG